jgi:hypothetical protein
LYEHAISSEFRMLDAEHAAYAVELESHWPLK